MDNIGMLARDSGFPPKHTNNISKSSSAMADFDYDAIFKNSASGNNDEAESKAKSVKLPVSDKPVYDDGIFDGLPGLKSKSMLSSASPRYEENVYASMAKSSPKRNQQSDHFNDLMENPIRAQKTEPNKQNRSNSNHRRSFDQSSSPPSSSQIGTSENVQVVDDIWLTVSEIPLFTKPTRSPPPSKPPPPIPRHVSKPERSSLHSNSRKVGNGLGLSSPNSTKNHPQSHRPFQPAAEEEMDSILAMKEAMDRAEAKFRHAKEVREREHTKSSRNRESMLDEERETGNKQAIERAAIEARLKSERAAVQRAQAEARDRAAVGAKERAERAAASRTNQQKNDNDLDSFFDPGSRPRRGPPEPHKGSIFGGGEFQEIEGESEERRRARLEREQRTQERAAKALAEKNQRDLQSQREQEERHKIGGILDAEIKRWAAGKEGNLRALLSTLQYILWAESGWQAVSMTDLISGGNVKKAYRKATLCIHPDKVQQKGATLQHKYVAEKVFDILKEAWNKFNSEELF